jgi:hypothetical protein
VRADGRPAPMTDHHVPRSTARLAGIALSLPLAIVLAACGTSAGSSGLTAGPSAVAPPAVAIDTDALVADATLDGQPVRVDGFFLATGDTAVLCSVVLESYPPQCGGGTVRLVGEVPGDVLAALDSTDDPALDQATWGQVEVTGTYRASGADGLPTIDLLTIALAAP